MAIQGEDLVYHFFVSLPVLFRCESVRGISFEESFMGIF